MESAELVPDDQEHPKRFLRVLDFREEVGIEAEGESDLGGLVKVGFEDVFVEYEEGFEDLEFVLVGSGLADFVVEFLVGEDLLGLETLVGKRWHELSLVCLRVVDHGEVHVQEVDLYERLMSMRDLK